MLKTKACKGKKGIVWVKAAETQVDLKPGLETTRSLEKKDGIETQKLRKQH